MQWFQTLYSSQSRKDLTKGVYVGFFNRLLEILDAPQEDVDVMIQVRSRLTQLFKETWTSVKGSHARIVTKDDFTEITGRLLQQVLGEEYLDGHMREETVAYLSTALFSATK